MRVPSGELIGLCGEARLVAMLCEGIVAEADWRALFSCCATAMAANLTMFDGKVAPSERNAVDFRRLLSRLVQRYLTAFNAAHRFQRRSGPVVFAAPDEVKAVAEDGAATSLSA